MYEDEGYTQRIEIHHHSGHITVAPLYLSESDYVILREQENEALLSEIQELIAPLLTEDTQVFLFIKSKANEQDIQGTWQNEGREDEPNGGEVCRYA